MQKCRTKNSQFSHALKHAIYAPGLIVNTDIQMYQYQLIFLKFKGSLHFSTVAYVVIIVLYAPVFITEILIDFKYFC